MVDRAGNALVIERFTDECCRGGNVKDGDDEYKNDERTGKEWSVDVAVVGAGFGDDDDDDDERPNV